MTDSQTGHTSLKTSAPLRIVYVLDKMVHGGSQRHVLNLVKALDRDHFTPELVLLEERGTWLKELQTYDLPVHDLQVSKVYSSNLFPAAWQLAAILDRPGTVCHALMHSPSIVAAIAKILNPRTPLLVGYREIFAHQKWYDWVMRMVVRFQTDHSLANSRAVARFVEGFEKRAPGSVTVLYNDVPAVPQREAKANLPGDEIKILFNGRFDWNKNHQHLIQALALIKEECPPFKLYCCGWGPMEADIKRLAEEHLPGQVEFLGVRSDVGSLLQSCDLAVLPSFSEAFSNAALEAAVRGVPLFLSAADGNLEMLSAEGAYFADPHSVEHMARILKEALKDKKARQEKGRLGQAQVAAMFPEGQMVQQMENLYRCLGAS